MFKAIVVGAVRAARVFRAVRAPQALQQTPPVIPGPVPDSAASATCHEIQPALLSREDAAKYLGVSAKTLATWASNKRVDLPYLRIGRRVMYRRSDLDAYCAANLVGKIQKGARHV